MVEAIDLHSVLSNDTGRANQESGQAAQKGLLEIHPAVMRSDSTVAMAMPGSRNENPMVIPVQFAPRIGDPPDTLRPPPVSGPSTACPTRIGPDAPTIKQYMDKNLTTSLMWELFETTHNDRCAESTLPASLRITQKDPDLNDKIKRWELISDDHAWDPRPEYGGRDLRPIATDTGNPGHFYAFGFSKENPHPKVALRSGEGGLPLEALDFYKDKTGGVHYPGQYEFTYKDEPNGTYTIEVYRYQAEGNPIGPPKDIGPIHHTLVGMTRYHEDARNNFLGLESYTGTQLSLHPGTPNFRMTMEPGGNGSPIPGSIRVERLIGSTYDIKHYQGFERGQIIPNSQSALQAKAIAQQTYFFDLFGPEYPDRLP